MRIAIHDFGGHPFVFELSRELARQGHQVGHFFFRDYPGPKGASRRLDSDPAALSIRPLTIARPYSTQKLGVRLRGNLAYARHAAREIRQFNPDVVLSGNTPTEIQGALLRAAHQSGAKFVYWMQDFYSLAVSALLRKRWLGAGRLIGAGYRLLDRRHLQASDAIVMISDSFRQEIAELGDIATLMRTIPNWGAIAEIDVRPKDNEWARVRGLTDRFVYLYSGTLGLKHDPLLLLNLARALEEDKKAIVVVAAQGAGREILEEHLAKAPQANLLLLDLQPIEALADMMGSADVLVALLEPDAGRFSVPSKVLSYLCAGRPILLSAPLENLSSQIVQDAEAGLAVPANQPEKFIERALALRTGSNAAEAGRNGRSYAESHFKINVISKKFEELFGMLK